MSDKEGKLIPFPPPKPCGDPDMEGALNDTLRVVQAGRVRGVLVVTFHPPGEGAAYAITGHVTQAEMVWILESIKHDMLKPE